MSISAESWQAKSRLEKHQQFYEFCNGKFYASKSSSSLFLNNLWVNHSSNLNFDMRLFIKINNTIITDEKLIEFIVNNER